MQESPFDKIAPFYDELFSDTEIGSYLKQIVWNYLDRNLPKSELNILEVNCGTGVDAIYLAGKGHNVIATDQSAEMIKNAQLKLRDVKSANVIFQQMDIRDIKNNFTEEKFDLVFSNFGGLNCIDKIEIKKLGKDIKEILNPGGRIIATIMPPLSIWDFLYFLFFVNPIKAVKRLFGKPIEAYIYESTVKVNYFSPGAFTKLLGDDFTVNKIISVGFFLPPTYLEYFFKRHSKFLERLNKYEKCIYNKPYLANLSNHYLIDLKFNE